MAPPGAGLSGLRRESATSAALGVALGGAGAACAVWSTDGWLVPVGVVGALAAAVAWASGHRLARRLLFLDELARSAQGLASGGQLQRIDERRLGGFAVVGRSFNVIFDGLGLVAHRVLAVVARVQDLPERITETLDEIDSAAQGQLETVEESASLMANMDASIRSINERIENLARAAEESASSILEMGSSVDEVSRNAEALQESVDASTSAVHEMSASIRQVSTGADSVQRIADETASSMTEMDRSVQEVGRHVKEATTLTEKVSEGATEGSAAVSETIRDIEQIQSLTNDARQKLEKLVGRLAEIAEILNVMGEINDETNLLSLNAAIIAAQAGEQGKAFLVVANHVKVLAQRTATSTKGIAQLLQDVESESDSAMTSMSAGMDAIELGVSRSRLAGESLATIRQSAADSSELVAEIARATEEQTRTSSLVAKAAQDTSSQVRQITTALSEQTRASEQMLANSQAALELCKHVYRSVSEQRDTGRYITQSISQITEMIQAIKANTAEHARASGAVSETVQHMLRNAMKSGDQIPRMNEMLAVLRDSAATIVGELGRFESARDGFSDSGEIDWANASDGPALRD